MPGNDLINKMSGKQRQSHFQTEPRASSSSSSNNNSHTTNNYAPTTSFLFVVVELVYDNEIAHRHAQPLIDEWQNAIPPINHRAYVSEIPSRVMRYKDGYVSEAAGYQWYRPESPPGSQGGVFASGEQQQYAIYAQQYKAFSVFSCNPHLPFVVMRGDPSVPGNDTKMFPLLFVHPQGEQRGISQAVVEDSNVPTNGRITKYVAGNNPSWVPGLVPVTYRNPYPNQPPSRGLSGELPIVIGLMAFSEPRDSANGTNRVDETFLGNGIDQGKWQSGLWLRSRAPLGYPLSTLDEPRGFLVTVFLDPENPGGSTPERLKQIEWFGILVHETPMN